MTQHYLSALFSPQSIALFGVTESNQPLLQHLLDRLSEQGYRGEIYPILPTGSSVPEHPGFDSLIQIDKSVDLALILTTEPGWLDRVRECAEQGVKVLMLLPTGVSSDQVEELTRLVGDSGMRIVGPNALGLIRPAARLNLFWGGSPVQRGEIALLSQSGAIATAILDWAHHNAIGFSTVIATGLDSDLDLGDYLDYLAWDPATKSILIYLETVENTPRFMSALRAAARVKPVIVLKAGRHEGAPRASLSHASRLVGRDEVVSAALARSGVVRVQTISQLFSAARLLAAPKKLNKGERLAILSNGAGPGVMARDRALDDGLILATLSEQTIGQLDQVLPQYWSHANPIDLAVDATAERYEDAVRICLEAEEVDALIVLLTPQAGCSPAQIAERLVKALAGSKKRVLVSWMGGTQVLGARQLFNQAKIPQFNTLEHCIDGFSFLADYQRNQRLLVQVPGRIKKGFSEPDRAAAQELFASVRVSGRTVLDEWESLQVLRAFKIPAPAAGRVRTAKEAIAWAEEQGYPVVLKVVTPELPHKSDIGGVRLNLKDADQVQGAFDSLMRTVEQRAPQLKIRDLLIESMIGSEQAREVMVGITRDPIFGPVITLGSGGTQVEILRDYQVALPPLNRKLARELISRTRISQMLGPYKTLPAVDFEALENLLLRVSNLACEMPELVELDINPVLVDAEGVVAVDAHMEISSQAVTEPGYDHLAIHPYPINLIKPTLLKNGERVVIRPVRPEDAEIEQRFISSLSDEAKYFRFMSVLRELTPEMLVRFTQIDYRDDMALIAVCEAGDEKEIGVARYSLCPDRKTCEFAVVISTEYEGQGLARQLMTQLIEVARARGLQTMYGEILANNRRMLEFMERLGFVVSAFDEDPTLKIARFDLQAAS